MRHHSVKFEFSCNPSSMTGVFGGNFESGNGLLVRIMFNLRCGVLLFLTQDPWIH